MIVALEGLTQAVTALSEDVQMLTTTVEQEATEMIQALETASGGDQAALQAALQTAIDMQTERLQMLRALSRRQDPVCGATFPRAEVVERHLRSET